MLRTNIIQKLIDDNGYKNYLEIGLGLGKNFSDINVANKISVDPNTDYGAVYQTTSDDFFASNTDTFDIVLVDGLHHADQVLKDIENSLEISDVVVCHDMNPIKEEHQTIPFNGGHWNGDCWKALVQLRKQRSDIEVITVDTDEGVGIIKKITNGNLLVSDAELTWENFTCNRETWLNLISVEEFLKQDISSLLKIYLQDVDNAEINWRLGLHYEDLGQCASAIGFYVRAAERYQDKLFQYECMLRAADCFAKQGIRKFSVKGMLQHAVAILPKRPEAYYYLMRILNNENGDGSWFDSYTYGSLALQFCDFSDIKPLRKAIDFPGKYAIEFERAHAAWHCGLCEESRDLHRELFQQSDIPAYLKQIIKNNLVMMNAFHTEKIEPYEMMDHKDMRHKFVGLDQIKKNYSESFQDMFVLAMTNGKRDGTYVEIGAGQSHYGNNTALLEEKFNWTGVSFDLNEDFVNQHNEKRSHTCLRRDATNVDYEKMLPAMGLPNDIDYLQIDCDPPEVSFRVLMNIPFETHRFAVITFEHDHYADPDNSIREKSRKYLESYGYQIVVNNIAPDDVREYEDWWVHPDLVDAELVKKMTLINDQPKKARKYMLREL